MPQHPRTIGSLAVLALLASGCTKPNPYAEPADEAADETDEPDDPPPTEDPDPADPEDPSGDDESGEPSDLPSTDLPDDDDHDADCTPLPELPNTCADCLTDSCCAPMTACAAVDDCECLATCMLTGAGEGMCKNACSAKPDETDELDPLLDCAQLSCAGSC